MNKSDSERIAASLEKKGYKPASQNDADLIVVNMCSVRQPAVDRVYGKVKIFTELKVQNPKLKTVLTGCITKYDKKKFTEKFDEIWQNKDYIENFPKCQKKSIAYIPISNGCSNFCTYCVVPFTRGLLTCRSHIKILKEAKRAIKNGAKEIWLLGQNVNDYKDGNVSFVKLLEMVNNIPGKFSIHFLSANPKDFSNELIGLIAKSKKISKYINLPVQSGDDKILRTMNRPYTVKQYKDLVKRIREKIPKINLATDIIVGFPGETKKQFENTKKLVKEICFNVAFISKYSSRPGTAASKMKGDVPRNEKERRWKILNRIINEKSYKKLIVILGPTASGKSDLAVKLAKRFNGEIVSADSRQIYKGLNIGTGKITKKEMRGVPHYLLDVASPKKKFTVVQYRNLTLKAIDKIFKKGKNPILCGGSGFYIQAIIDGIVIPEVKPNWKLRKKLEKKPVHTLYKILKKFDPKRARNIDKNNPRRLIRAIEIVMKTKKSIPAIKNNPLPYPVLLIGIKKEKGEIKKLIKKRLSKRLKKGMIAEVKNLRKNGLSWKRLEEFGLEYRWITRYLQNKISYKEMAEDLQKDSENYAKRQMTWFTRQNFAKQNLGGLKHNRIINWVKNYRQAEKLTKEFF